MRGLRGPHGDLPLWKRALFASTMALLPVLSLAAVELGARVYFWARLGVPGKQYGIFRPDSELGAVQQENAYNSMGETNNLGFRNHEDVRDPKPPGSLRVIAYGGSTTFCYNLHGQEAWPARLEQQMRARRPGGANDQVLNGGAVMWSIGQILVRAKRDVPVVKPDYVLIYSGVNEDWNTRLLAAEGVSMDLLVSQGHYGVFTKRLEQANWIKRELMTYKLYQKAIWPTAHRFLGLLVRRQEPSYPASPDPSTLENYLHVLRELVEFLKANDAKPVFVVEITGDPTPKNVYLTSYSHAGAKVASELGAIVVDPSPILEGNPGGPKSLYIDTGVHYSDVGARRLASFLYERIFAAQTEPIPGA